MKALLMKDVFTVWKQMKIILVLIAIFAVCGSDYQATFAVIYAALIPYTAFAYDERSKWNRMAAMMPYSAYDIVLSKYVFGWLAVAGSFLLTIVSKLVTGIITENSFKINMLLLAFFAAIIAIDIILPLMFRFGVEKARVLMLILVVLICGGASGVSFVAKTPEIYASAGMYIITAAIAVLATVLSVPFSKYMYEKRMD